jgi:transcriptional regulator with XRE-family HTH domain
MSPRKFDAAPADAVVDAVHRFWAQLGLQIREARLARKWSVSVLAERADVSRATTYFVESGRPTSVEAGIRIAAALGLRLDVQLTDPKRKRDRRPDLSGDVVHSYMGEFEAGRFRELGFQTGLDEPYQHYQHAGRADFIAYDRDARALLHIENRTRFPDFQEMAGAFNGKRAYLGEELAQRFGVGRWSSETHMIAALWSSEVLHALRLRTESFRSLAPDPTAAFEQSWSGAPPNVGTTKTLIVLDPTATGRQTPWIPLDDALTSRPRYRGYGDAAARIATPGTLRDAG